MAHSSADVRAGALGVAVRCSGAACSRRLPWGVLELPAPRSVLSSNILAAVLCFLISQVSRWASGRSSCLEVLGFHGD